jgi:ABC-type antimicrobial peptide transport system permease subunit
LRWLAGLQAAHVTLTVVLLACAFLMIRSVRAGLTTELGFAADQVIYLFVQPRLGQHATDAGDLDTTSRQNDYQQLIERIREIPTVEHATHGVSPYLRQARELRPKELRLRSTSHSLRMVTVAVGPEFFRTVGIPVIAGRDFDRTDIEGSNAAIVSEALATSISPGRPPIGETIVVNGSQRLQIVGIAGDALRAGFDGGLIPAVYTAAPIRSEGIGIGVVVRTKGDAHQSMAAVLDVAKRVFPRPVQLEASTARDDMREELASQRLSGWLFGVFAFIAVALSIFGMYGLVISRILRRTRELAIHLALGATTDGLMVRTIMDAFVPVLFGCCAGLLLAAVAGRSISSYLIGVAPHDSVALSAAVLTLMLPTVVAATMGARRLRRVDPAVMLRE